MIGTFAENGKELLPMSAVLLYLLESYKPVTTPQEASFIRDDSLAFREFAEKTRGTLVINADRVRQMRKEGQEITVCWQTNLQSFLFK